MTSLPAEVEALRARTHDFIRDVVIAAEPAPGERLTDARKHELQAQAKAAGVFWKQEREFLWFESVLNSSE